MSNSAAKKDKKTLALTIVIAVTIMGAIAIRFFVAQPPATARSHAEMARADVPAEAIFVPLGENFTVNLRGEESEEGDQYLQAGITLKVLQPGLEAKIKAAMPEIRDKLALLLSRKKPSELQTAEGKAKLAAEIIAETDAMLGLGAPAVIAPIHQTVQDNAGSGAPAATAQAAPAAPKSTGVTDVQFTSFIIQ